ncbi:hypothetical protein PCANC_22052 [Puccinia coronata f. sp. avenae]|uniref:Uncharacterized protein n=1 Tax=Puccinia coronata f. sp. avenae TaxID=200324 RepID=A0A2N5S3I5_9BASI|nr:hypothetical protein PCANC_24222 [Puccinia coronata f. sp. avenae]PLW27047.1 hypothetical protein PCANC_22052 [Puccinia coronata f. sp. avenae]
MCTSLDESLSLGGRLLARGVAHPRPPARAVDQNRLICRAEYSCGNQTKLLKHLGLAKSIALVSSRRDFTSTSASQREAPPAERGFVKLGSS